MSRCGSSLSSWSNSAVFPRRTITRQDLGEFGPLANSLTFVVEDVDGDGEKEGKASENSGGPLEVVFLANVLVNCVGRAVSIKENWQGFNRGTYRESRT